MRSADHALEVLEALPEVHPVAVPEFTAAASFALLCELYAAQVGAPAGKLREVLELVHTAHHTMRHAYQAEAELLMLVDLHARALALTAGIPRQRAASDQRQEAHR